MLLAGPALAADMGVPRGAPAGVEPAFSWTGFYLGYNSGGARGTLRDPLVNPGLVSSSQDTRGLMFGGQIGYNWQVNSWVFGVEADYDWARINGNTPTCGFQILGSCDSRLRSIGTVRGKLGYAVNNVMWYGTGGFAYGDQRLTFTNRAGFEDSSSRWLSGWTAGAGMAWAPWGGNIVTHIEALYFDLRSDRGAADIRHNGMMVRTGLSYKFNWAAPVAVMASY
ncbi:MAG TPA: hypothetical protein VGD36_04260 [Xanthobacteraceae bacterium]